MVMEHIEKTLCERISGILNNDCEMFHRFYKRINENIKAQSRLINLN